ncbi:hypothetical protein SAY87_028679 [Trapa incisa]|uniref:Cytochrome B561-related protein n=1 Tax=Trapa incisa TaxID=236973 RepID=A0AAN7QS92_9MYRT|nr:hypothetical protein SAY87_028679 [Trapa incisa]
MDGGTRDGAPSPAKPGKFTVYQNPALAAALTANSIQPPRSSLFYAFLLCTASTFAFLSFIVREDGFIGFLRLKKFSEDTTYLITIALKAVGGLVVTGTIMALCKVIYLLRGRNNAVVPGLSSSKGTKDQPTLTRRQLGLLGLKPKVEQVVLETPKRPPKTRPLSTPTSDVLVPLHQHISSSSLSSRISKDGVSTGGGGMIKTISTPSKSPGSSLYLVPGGVSPLPSQKSPGLDVSTPWSDKRRSYNKEITSEEKLELFLAEVDEKITGSASKLATPASAISGFGVASPTTAASSASTSGTARSTPLRPVRMSPGSQKFTTPPKKGEGDLPPPMSLEESVEAFKHLGIYPEIEMWRDRLRQWFSSVLLKPLLKKIENSHTQVMQTASKLGVSVTVSQVGSVISSNGTPTETPTDRAKEWLPAFTLDEEGLLQQLRSNLVQALDASMPKVPPSNVQQTPQQNPLVPMMQECVDAVTEHQRLQSLLKGELIKGILPQSNVPTEYMVKRIRELAEGTCLKNYEYLGSGEVFDKVNKKWILQLPTDSHLLLYLFCAFLEHPKWMLHVDPASYSGAQSSKNPLLLGVLPPKERFPEKYIAVISGVPSTLHPGACIIVVGRQSPPIFALYWDKKLQFSLQGRTALWDTILILCDRIKAGYGGVVRGMHLGSSALNILPVLDAESEDLRI